MPIRVTGDPAMDAMLTDNPFALLTAMLLDQQIPMEKAFSGPKVIEERIAEEGHDSFDPATIAGYDPERFAALCSRPPAIHRFPGSMAGRVQTLARAIVADYDGEASRVWTDPGDATKVLTRLKSLPGFGDQKASIFLALIAKQLGVRPRGWKTATGPYGEAKAYRSVADVIDPESLAKVRAHKREMKQAAKEQTRSGS